MTPLFNKTCWIEYIDYSSLLHKKTFYNLFPCKKKKIVKRYGWLDNHFNLPNSLKIGHVSDWSMEFWFVTDLQYFYTCKCNKVPIFRQS